MHFKKGDEMILEVVRTDGWRVLFQRSTKHSWLGSRKLSAETLTFSVTINRHYRLLHFSPILLSKRNVFVSSGYTFMCTCRQTNDKHGKEVIEAKLQ